MSPRLCSGAWLGVAVGIASLTSAGFAGIRYVDDSAPPGGNGLSWASPHRFLADALSGAPPGTEIRIAGGVYPTDRSNAAPNGSGNRALSFVLSGGIKLLGGYAGYGAENPGLRDTGSYLTVLSGDLLGNDAVGGSGDNAYHVVKVQGGAAANVIDGLVIAYGNANGGGADGAGGGALVTGGTPTFASVGFWGNAGTTGGALRLEAALANSLIAGCTFYDNHSGGGSGGIDMAFGPLTVAYCLFHSNSTGYHGGAVLVRPTSGAAIFTMLGCTITQTQTNVSGAVNIFTPTQAEIRDCVFTENGADSGPAGLASFHPGTRVIGCDFHANNGGIIGAIGLWQNSGGPGTTVVSSSRFWNNSCGFRGGAGMMPIGPLVSNVVAAENVAAEAGGAFHAPGTVSHSTLVANIPDAIESGDAAYNSIFWANEPVHFTGGGLNVAYSLVEGGWTGSGVVDGDPLFVAYDVQDLRLQESSPAVNAGSLSLVPLDLADVDDDGLAAEQLPWDIDMLPRVQAGAPDMGAHEGTSEYVPPSDGAEGVDPGETVELVAGGGVPGVGAVGATMTNQSEVVGAQATLLQIGYDPHPQATGYTEEGVVAELGTSIPAGQHLTQVRVPITLYTLYPHGDLPGMRLARFDADAGAWRLAVASNHSPAVNASDGGPVGTYHALYSINGSPVNVPTALGDHGVVWEIPAFKGYLFANVDRDGQFGVGRDLCQVDIAPGDGDGVVDGADLGAVLSGWGAVGAGAPGDADGDGVVGPDDLGFILSNWGGCVASEDSGGVAGEGGSSWASAYAALGGPLPPKARGSVSVRRADLTADGRVDGADVGILLAAWASANAAADLDRSGAVDGADLGLLLARWGETVR